MRARVNRLRTDPITANGLLIMLNGMVTSAVGYSFWTVAARLYTASEVGLASAAIAAGTLISVVSDLGLRSWVMSVLPQERDDFRWSSKVSGSVVATLFSVLTGSLVAVLVLRAVHSPVTQAFGAAWTLLFMAFAVFTSWNLLLDGIAEAERSGKSVLARNTLLSFLKVVALLLLALSPISGHHGILLSGTVAAAAAAAYGLTRQLRAHRSSWRFTPLTAVETMRSAGTSIISHHVLTLSGYLPAYLTPVIIVSLVGAEDTAYFSLTWMLGSVFFIVSPTIGSMLFVQGRWDPADLASALRRSIKLVASLMLPLAFAAIVFGHSVLSFFGRNYADHGYPVLCILALSSIPDAITNLYVGVLRARGRLREAAVLNAFLAICAVALVWVLVPWLGISGAATSWLVAQSAGSVWVVFSVIGRRSNWSPKHSRAGSTRVSSPGLSAPRSLSDKFER